MTLPSDPAVRDYIAQTPVAVGYVDQALTAPLHVLAFDGVGCTRATIASGAYPAPARSAS